MDGYGISHEQRNWMIALVLPIQIVTTLLLWIRLLSRFHRSGGQPGFDDVLVFVGWVLGTSLSATVLLGTYQYGYNRHIWDVPLDLWPKAALTAFLVEILFLFSTCSTKISILLFYRRLVSDTCSRNFKLAVWAAIAFVAVYTIAFVGLMLINCDPVKAIWMQHDHAWTRTHSYKCVSNHIVVAASEAAGGLSVVTDFYSVMLPAVLLMRIRTNGRQRFGLIFIFGLGYLVVAAGCVRTVYLGRAQGVALDKFWLAFNVFASAVAECNMSIVCACAPSVKALFSRHFRDLATKMSDISDSDLQSRVESIQRSTSRRPGSDTFTRVIGSNTDLNSSVTSTELRPSEVDLQDILEGAKAGNTRWSFKEAHEYGMANLGPIAEAYEEPPYWHEHSATVPIFPDTENVATVIDHKGGADYWHEPSSKSPRPSLTSEIAAGDEKSEISSFSFVNPSESGDCDEAHLIPTSANGQNSLVPPRYVQQSPSSKPLRPPTPALLRTPFRSTLSPWTASMTKTMLEGNTGPSARRKLGKMLSTEKWEQKKKQVE